MSKNIILGLMTGVWAVLFIFMILGFTIRPVYSQELEIQTIPQDDQLRRKGIMILCPSGSLCSTREVRKPGERGSISADADFPFTLVIRLMSD
ncbi:MAG: hypothetical protein ACREOW_06970 [Thermodesulfobacteriota bacterium]